MPPQSYDPSVIWNGRWYLMFSSTVVVGHLVMMAESEEQVLRHWLLHFSELPVTYFLLTR
ncbi:unnamed protein product, partial [Musa textilis]